jgi:predicted HTH transcriptional regulator
MQEKTNEQLRYLKKLIDKGEHQYLDFKFAITDSRKIARSLVAFSNSGGGTLLIGVKDNGNISGIRSEEEIYMVDAAATLYCRPEVKYKLRLWEPAEKKQVLEVIVRPAASRLWKAQADDGRWKVWLRLCDQNIMADHVWELVWKKKQSSATKTIIFDKHEQLVLSHLSHGRTYKIEDIVQLTGLTDAKVNDLISDFIVLGLMDMNLSESGLYYSVKHKLHI